MHARLAIANVVAMRHQDSADGSDLPLVHRLTAHRYSKTELTVIDVVAVVLIAALSKSYMRTRRRRCRATRGTSSTGSVTVWLRPSRLLGVESLARPSCSSSHRRCGDGCARGRPSVFFVLMALYSVVAVSPRRRASYIAGAVVVAMVIATVAGGGNQVVESCIGVVASMLLAWAAGENTRASRLYALHQAERIAERDAAAAAEQADQVLER